MNESRWMSERELVQNFKNAKHTHNPNKLTNAPKACGKRQAQLIQNFHIIVTRRHYLKIIQRKLFLPSSQSLLTTGLELFFSIFRPRSGFFQTMIFECERRPVFEQRRAWLDADLLGHAFFRPHKQLCVRCKILTTKEQIFVWSIHRTRSKTSFAAAIHCSLTNKI